MARYGTSFDDARIRGREKRQHGRERRIWSGVNADGADAKLISEVPYGDNSLQKIYTNLARKTT
ncbi:hypothetical protein AGR4C_Lc90044 [Agrobacterium tumefaciens str. Kerr 14]|uniref:Transposase n=1 Tax=Agrobacterium tumefaciens str. Kerr 14 TaxID=1183424 RepID=A0A1S7S5Y7_AGRTU|nr:hypothetical protein AGR4C_Lc90044 [Agrobacterium tumefaciens str. Kerr 14]